MGSSGPATLSNQQERQQASPEYEPVFRQVKTTRVGTGSLGSYFVTTPTNASSDGNNMENVSTPVFQFCQPSSNTSVNALRNRDEEVNKVSEGLSSINVTD